ncbi:MAG: Gfo/Idh/MocA family oxidoreductase [Verrucomicrobiota bacterium]
MNISRSFTRRNFLKTALLAGSAPLILRSHLWAAESAPSKQFTLGFIGIGKQGNGLLGACLPRKDVRVLAVSDVDSTRRNLAKSKVEAAYGKNQAAGSYKGCDAYSDFRELLARKDIDAVVIATPDHWHALIAIAAANAGKDIYCEKPMAHTVLEGRAMVKAVRANQRVFQVGSMQRSMSEFRAACELIRNGVIGTVAKVDAAVGGPPIVCNLPAEPAEPGLDWDLWQGPAPERPYNSILSPRGMPKNYPQWRHYREYGGGGVCDWGAHHFDIVQWAFGCDETGPVEFYPAVTPKAEFGVRWRYASGLEVTHQKGNGITFYGDKGKIMVNRGRFQLWLNGQIKAETMDNYSPLLKELLPANAVRLYRSTNQIADWIKCMESREKPVCDVETGQRSATICNLANAVYFSGKGIKWDPQAEQFADGTGEAAWLTREYRAPWKLS